MVWKLSERRTANRLSTRRDLLRLGGLVAAGTLSDWPLLCRTAAASSEEPSRAGRGRSCILIYLLGGPSQLDTWDLKPNAPAEIRGPFRPISTSVPGVQFCEHLPRMARIAHKIAVVRAVSHPNNNHTPMIYYTLTGHHVATPTIDNDTSPPRRTDFPHLGSVVAHLRPPAARVPGFVSIPGVAVRSNLNNSRPANPLRGGRAGLLGPSFDPLIINDDPRSTAAVPGLNLPGNVTYDRFQARNSLLATVESASPEDLADRGWGELRQLAVHLTGSANRGSNLYSLEREPPPIRERYGRNRFGQSLLLARRLVEAGVPLVAIHFNNMTRCDGWDTHGQNFAALSGELLPLLDQGLSALLEDLEQRGRLEQTLVCSMGEFGRTPRINPNAGRDHWGHCQSVVMAGGGIRPGLVYGASDNIGAYPREGKVDPVDIHATIYHCLGIDPAGWMTDRENRPHKICSGRAIQPLLS